MREDELDFLDKEKKKEKEKKKKHSASGRGQIGWYIKKICGFANDGLYRLPSILLSFPKEFTSFANKVRLENSRSRLPSFSSSPNRTVLLPLASSDKDSLPSRSRDAKLFPAIESRKGFSPLASELDAYREFFLIIARQQQNAYLSLSRPFLPSSLSLVEPSSLILSALIPPSLSNCFSPAIPLENWSTVELPVFGTRKMVDNSLEHVCASV